MLALISPAKKLDFETESSIAEYSQPDFIEQASALVNKARKLSRRQLAQTMKLSDALAELNYQRFKSFSTPFDLSNAKQAALMFNGDTYVGLKADTLTDDDFAFAQDHLRILSGLYGLLRPLDLIQPYRLEMGARFKPPKSEDLWILERAPRRGRDRNRHRPQRPDRRQPGLQRVLQSASCPDVEGARHHADLQGDGMNGV